jgi:vacuolar protein sorting-associated protein 35
LHHQRCITSFLSQVLEKFGKDMVDSKCVKKIVELLSLPLDSLSLRILNLVNYEPLMAYLADYYKKQVATTIVKAVLKSKTKLDSVEKVDTLFKYVSTLIKGQGGEEETKVADEDRYEFDQEQHLMAQLFHLIQHEDTDVQFQLYQSTRKHFGQGGTQRIEYTLPPLLFGVLKLLERVQVREKEGDETLQVKSKKIFGFVHETISVLSPHYPELALRLFLQAAQTADQGGYEAIAYEFVAQAFICYEDEIADSKAQYTAINYIVALLPRFKVFDKDNCDTLVSKATQHCAKLLKKTDQCRAVYNCAHLFWPHDDDAASENMRDEKRALQCLQRALKIANACIGHQVHLFVEILNKYLYFFDRKCPSITTKYLKGLIDLIDEQMPSLDASETSKVAKAHYWNTIKHIKLKAALDDETGALYRSIPLNSPEP